MGKSGFVWLIVVIILLVVGAVILTQTDTIKKLIDPCERTFTDCNHGCGEGILNSLCKEKCTYDYNVCEKG